MPPTPEQRTEIEEKLRRTVERRLAGEIIQLSWGDTIPAMNAVQMVSDEVESLRQRIADLMPQPTIALTDGDVQQLFARLTLTSSGPLADGTGYSWEFNAALVLQRDDSTGDWILGLAAAASDVA